MTRILGALAAVPMLALASTASPDEAKPVVLDMQALDAVSASGTGIGTATAGAVNSPFSSVATFTDTGVTVVRLGVIPTQVGALSNILTRSTARAVATGT